MKQALDIETTVSSAFASQFATDERSLTADTSLQDDLGGDSLAIVEVLVGLEQTLKVELGDSDAFLAGLQTLGDVVRAFEAARDESSGVA